MGQSITVWDPVTCLVMDIVCEKRVVVNTPPSNHIPIEDLIARIALDDPNRLDMIEFLREMYTFHNIF